MFCLVSHTKKRPDNLVIGRLFDAQLIGMIECAVSSYTSMSAFEGKRKAVVHQGSKPLVIFQGTAFDTSDEMKIVQSMLLDLFRGEVLTHINLQAIDRVIIVTASESSVPSTATDSSAGELNAASCPLIHIRHYGVLLKKSGSRLPRVEFDDVGPHFDLRVRRLKTGSSSLVDESMKTSKLSSGAKRVMKRNMEVGRFGETHGRVHMMRQNLDNVNVRATRGMKRAQRDGDGDGQDEGAEDGVHHTAVDASQRQPEPEPASKRIKL